MAGYTLSDGVSVVSIVPEYDVKKDGRKIESSHRTTTGAGYRYVWGHYHRAKFSTQYVNSSDACTINSWWGANSAVVLRDASSSVIVSGYLVNASAPIDQYNAPYTDMMMGIIELESF